MIGSLSKTSPAGARAAASGRQNLWVPTAPVKEVFSPGCPRAIPLRITVSTGGLGRLFHGRPPPHVAAVANAGATTIVTVRVAWSLAAPRQGRRATRNVARPFCDNLTFRPRTPPGTVRGEPGEFGRLQYVCSTACSCGLSMGCGACAWSLACPRKWRTTEKSTSPLGV